MLLVFLALLLALSVSPAARADTPLIKDNGNASRTISWAFTSPQNLTSWTGTRFANGHAELNWTYENLSWPTGSSIAANGSLGANLTTAPAGIVLKADSANHVVNGTFNGGSPWAFTNSTDDNVTAEWDAMAHTGELNTSSASNEKSWDGLDGSTLQLQSNWAAAAGSCAVALKSNSSNAYTPPGMMEVNLSVGPCSVVRVVNITGAQDWSHVDRLVFWADIPRTLPSPSFNITSLVGPTTYTTPAQTLAYGPQQVVVDLSQLPVSRASLSSVTLRFNFQSTSFSTPTSLYIDDLRIANAKVFHQTASLSQLVVKTNTTSSQPGSARLSFDWILANDTGVVSAAPVVNLTNGPVGVEIPMKGTARTWNAFSADVSAATPAAGVVNLSFRLDVAENNTGASNVTLQIDNVTLFFPNRTNGTYLSKTTALEADSQLLQISWAASLPVATTLSFQMRTGTSSNGTGLGWTPWSTWTTPGTYLPGVSPNPYLQFRAQLATTNASSTPALESVRLMARHRAASGTIISPVSATLPDFLHWDNVSVWKSGGPSTSVSLSLGNGSYWTPWALQDNITAYPGRYIAWRIDLNTQDGLETPSVMAVNLTYDYLGPFQDVVITPSGPLNLTTGTWLHLTAIALDAGGHVNASAYFVWTTTDPALRIYQNGTYYAATPGNWTVTALASGTSYHASVPVRVREAAGGSALPSPSDPLFQIALVTLLGAIVAFAIYEVAIRRMFSIDDVFLIAKDGRLILHNTRRMRADRDEDILSGMLTAIMAFLRDSDPEENGELKRFAVGGKTTLLERGKHVYLSAVYSGRVPRWAAKDLHRFMADLEDRFGEDFATWSGSPEDLHDLKGYMQRFVAHMRYRTNPNARRMES